MKENKLYRNSDRYKNMRYLEDIETESQALCYHNDLMKLSLPYQNSHQMPILFRPQKRMFNKAKNKND